MLNLKSQPEKATHRVIPFTWISRKAKTLTENHIVATRSWEWGRGCLWRGRIVLKNNIHCVALYLKPPTVIALQTCLHSLLSQGSGIIPRMLNDLFLKSRLWNQAEETQHESEARWQEAVWYCLCLCVPSLLSSQAVPWAALWKAQCWGMEASSQQPWQGASLEMAPPPLS